MKRILFVNIDAAFDEFDGAFGNTARKCLQIVTRESLAVTKDTLLVVYKKPSKLYLKTMESIKGFMPRMLALKKKLGAQLCMSKAVMGDERLMRKLERSITPETQLNFFYFGPLEQQLVERLGVKLPYNSKAVSEVSKEMNNKDHFKSACECLGIPTVPGSKTVKGIEKIAEEVVQMYEAHGGVMVRDAAGAGGLGNIKVTPVVNPGDIKQYFLSMVDVDLWKNITALVEPFLQEVGTPTISCRVNPDGSAEFLRDLRRFIKNGGSIGSVSPSGYDAEVIAKLKKKALFYGHYLSRMGYVGDYDIDFGIMEDGSTVAYECNARRQGGSFAHEAKFLLHGEDASEFFVRTNDSLRIPPSVTYRQILDFISSKGIKWDKDNGGVVVSIEPMLGTFGVWISARSYERCDQLNQAMEDFALSTYSRKVAPTVRVKVF